MEMYTDKDLWQFILVYPSFVHVHVLQKLFQLLSHLSSVNTTKVEVACYTEETMHYNVK